MTGADLCPEEMLRENEQLRAQVEELQEVLRAIRSGEVDAIVGSPDQGSKVFTLESAETPYRHFVEGMDQGAFIFDAYLTILYCNRKFAEMVGSDIHTIIGSSCSDFLSPADLEICRTLSRVVGKVVPNLKPRERYSREIVFDPPHQKQIPVRLDIGLLENRPDAPTYSAILTDLSLIRKNEEITRAENFARSILDNIGDAVFVCDAENIVIRANAVACRICDCNPVAKPFSDVMTLIPVTGERETPWVPTASDTGAELPIEATFTPDGKETKTLYVHASEMVDSTGRVIGRVVAVRDISEIRGYEHALWTANRKLNMLSDITRHDILNQVFVLTTSLHMISENELVTDELRKLLKFCNESTETINRIITFTRNYQELGVKAPGWHNVSHIAEAASQSPEFAGLDIRCETGILEVLADPMIENVFRNFFDNALRHGNASEVTISSAPDDSRVIYVRDNGRGVQSALKEKIFERGFGEHTGFGLFLAREILEITGATIQETGTPGSGACLRSMFRHRGGGLRGMDEGDWRIVRIFSRI